MADEPKDKKDLEKQDKKDDQIEVIDRSDELSTEQKLEKLEKENKALLAEIMDKKKKLNAKIEAEEKSKKKELEEKERFKELYEGEQKKVQVLEQKYKSSTIKNAIISAAHSAGAVDAGDIVAILGGNFELDENGNVLGVNETVEQLKTDKPHLFVLGDRETISTHNKRPNITPHKGKVFTRSEIGDMTPEEYQRNRDEIMRQTREGLIKEE